MKRGMEELPHFIMASGYNTELFARDIRPGPSSGLRKICPIIIRSNARPQGNPNVISRGATPGRSRGMFTRQFRDLHPQDDPYQRTTAARSERHQPGCNLGTFARDVHPAVPEFISPR